jgi:hypothetical protein
MTQALHEGRQLLYILVVVARRERELLTLDPALFAQVVDGHERVDPGAQRERRRSRCPTKRCTCTASRPSAKSIDEHVHERVCRASGAASRKVCDGSSSRSNLAKCESFR